MDVASVLAAHWGLGDDETTELRQLVAQLAPVMPAQIGLNGTPVAGQAHLEELLQGPDVEAWVNAVEDPQVDRARKLLVLDALALYSERVGLHHRVAELARRASREPDLAEDVRAGAMRALARARPPQLVSEWVKGLAAPDASTRVGAAQLLGWARAPEALRPLARVVVDGDAPVVPMALWAIGETRHFDAMVQDVLVAALESRFCIEETVEALGNMGNWAALGPVLANATRGDGVNALVAASRIVERSMPVAADAPQLANHVGILQHLVHHHGVPAVRVLAAAVLVRLGQNVAAETVQQLMRAAADAAAASNRT